MRKFSEKRVTFFEIIFDPLFCPFPHDSYTCMTSLSSSTTPGAANAPPTPPTKETRVLNDNLQRLKLDVQQIAPIHGRLVTIQEFRRAVGANSTN